MNKEDRKSMTEAREWVFDYRVTDKGYSFNVERQEQKREVEESVFLEDELKHCKRERDEYADQCHHLGHELDVLYRRLEAHAAEIISLRNLLSESRENELLLRKVLKRALNKIDFDQLAK